MFYKNRDKLINGVTNAANASEAETFFYHNVCPKLQVHGLADNEKVAGVRYRRSFVSRFPNGMTPRDTAKGAPTGQLADAITVAGRILNTLRENWLNPSEWVDRVPEVVAGYPDRIVAKPGHENDLKKRTLTKLYNARPTWLDNAHKTV